MADQFLFIGDSLIEFFDWQKRFPGRHILNFGIAGETAEGLLSRLPGIIKRFDSPDLVLLMTGINNLAMEDYGFLFTYEKIINSLQEAYEKTTIVISSLLPADLFFLGGAVPRVNKRLIAISQKYEILYLNLYPRFIDNSSRLIPAYFETDGVHLSLEGYEVWARTLEQKIFPLLD